ncbi:hypothetical protein ER308_14560 [Egibacter rhizosphaerae]|uniref:Uncharacterized protein n=1 Tax=Egibacter rhizosphaerae TaxID=1670831 RepID=A0A411YHR6_9ACTN|nr:hypothetical protein [Egibacter rhizosphaerae]QBI20659.1 hypothetical protein ER308_14560 [Egibacter rhizosphaerae]
MGDRMSGVGRGAVRLLAVAGGIALARRVTRSSQWQFAKLGGWSIAGPTAAGWATDFLNAAYFRRPPGLRDVDDLRLAFAILTTRWHRLARPLHAGDVAAFHHAFGVDRFLDTTTSGRGALDRSQLLEGAARLHGDWFPEAYADDERRAWGIVFATTGERAAYRPEDRLRHARVGPLSPPVAPATEQTWHTYPPVEVPDTDATLGALLRPETWPDYASEIGRFTPLRSGGLEGQTFEIEVTGHPTSRTPVFLRAYVTVTRLVSRDDGRALDEYVAELNDGLRRFGRDEPPAVPEGGEPVAAFDLTTHEGHFLGNARNRLLLFEHDGRSYLRAAGTWDPLRWDLAQLYERVGYAAQPAMWGGSVPEESMLHQIGERVAAQLGGPR